MIIEQEYDTGKYMTWDFSNNTGLQYNKTTAAYESYVTANYDHYFVAATERGTASQIYEVAVPTVVAAGDFKARFRVGVEGAEAETDTIIATQRHYALDATVAKEATLTTIHGHVDDILADTAEIGAAGAGLTAVGLAATGLDAIAVPTLSAPAATFVGKVTQLWDRFFRKVVKDISANTIKVYASDDSTVVTSQTIAETVTTETQGKAS